MSRWITIRQVPNLLEFLNDWLVYHILEKVNSWERLEDMDYLVYHNHRIRNEDILPF